MRVLQGWVTVGAMLVATSGCDGASGPPGEAVAGQGADVPAGTAELLAGVPPGWLPGDPCNPQTDGWKAEPIPVTADVQRQIDEGQPVLLQPPPGYQARAPRGVPACLSYGPPDQGSFQASCNADADCPNGSVCPVGYDYCVTPCQGDGDCKAPGECLTGRLEVPFCGCRYEGCSKDPVPISM